MDAERVTSEGGWAAPLDDGAVSRAAAAGFYPEIPWVGVRRGGIQHPMDIVTTMSFEVSRRAWWRRWSVQGCLQRTGTLYGEPWAGPVQCSPVARRWRRKAADAMARDLNIAAQTR